MYKFVPLLLLIALPPACSKDTAAEPKKMASLCVEATRQLEAEASAKDETFRLQLSNALDACSVGCDEADETSCKALDRHVATVCKVNASICQQLCETTSGSLKVAACKHQ